MFPTLPLSGVRSAMRVLGVQAGVHAGVAQTIPSHRRAVRLL